MADFLEELAARSGPLPEIVEEDTALPSPARKAVDSFIVAQLDLMAERKSTFSMLDQRLLCKAISPAAKDLAHVLAAEEIAQRKSQPVTEVMAQNTAHRRKVLASLLGRRSWMEPGDAEPAAAALETEIRGALGRTTLEELESPFTSKVKAERSIASAFLDLP